MLCRWGMAKAREEGSTVTLFASVIGKMLYEKLGFKQVGMAHVQVDGEEEGLDIPAMVAGSWWCHECGDGFSSMRGLVHLGEIGSGKTINSDILGLVSHIES